MTLRRTVYYFIFFLLLLGADQAKACCSDRSGNPEERSEPSCGQVSVLDTPPLECALHTSQHSECPCDHGNNGCGCPGCGIAGHSGSASVPETDYVFSGLPFNGSVQKMAFYIVEHMPEDVYLPIWHPPQIV